jgi:site-specific DNA-methyltransferase (adenine-specific)
LVKPVNLRSDSLNATGQKPIALIHHFIKMFTDPGDIVFDPMCGSGSTLLAGLLSGRQVIGMRPF